MKPMIGDVCRVTSPTGSYNGIHVLITEFVPLPDWHDFPVVMKDAWKCSLLEEVVIKIGNNLKATHVKGYTMHFFETNLIPIRP